MSKEIINQVAQDILKLAPQIITDLKTGFSKEKMKRLTQSMKASTNIGIQDVVTELDHQIGQLYIEEIYKKYKDYLRIDWVLTNHRLWR